MAKGKGNNTAGRVKTNNYKVIKGQVVKPVLYAGRSIGHGQYMAGTINDKLVVDSTGKPLAYAQISELVI